VVVNLGLTVLTFCILSNVRIKFITLTDQVDLIIKFSYKSLVIVAYRNIFC